MEYTAEDLREFSSGERCYFAEDKIGEGMVKEHFDRYRFALGKLTGKEKVLDAACGTGYGSSVLADKAKGVIGIDVSKHAIDFAKNRYKKNNLNFQVADLNKKIALNDNEFDAIISFETIEHVAGQDNMLLEFKRMLKSGGRLIISTPDNDLMSGGIKSDNPFHIKEMNRKEFISLLGKYFNIEEFYGQTKFVILPLWKRFIKGFRVITPLRKLKQFILKKTGLEMKIHQHFKAEEYSPMERTDINSPNKYYVLIAVCRKI